MATRFIEPEKKIRSEVRENLEARCAQCSYCHGKGLVTVFHEKYTGEPYITLKKRDGTVKAYALRAAATCTCPLGSWMRDARDPDDATAMRHASVKLQDVIEGRIPWSIDDPTLPRHDPGEVPDWADVLSKIRDGSVVKSAKAVLKEKPRFRETPKWVPEPNRAAPPVRLPESVPLAVSDDEEAPW